MTRFGLAHLLMILVSAIFLALTSYAVTRMRRNWHNVMFALAAIIAMGGMFFRFAMENNFDSTFNFQALLLQMLDVTGFAFLLLPLALIPRLHLAQQYCIFFMLPALAISIIVLPKDLIGLAWNDMNVLIWWLYTTFAIACPMWMIAARRARPERKYIIPVSVCVFFYFTVVYLISDALIKSEVITEQTSFSFIYNTEGTLLIDLLHKLIPLPYFHLYPLIPVVVGLFIVFAIPFNKRLSFDANGGEGSIKERIVPIYSLAQLPWRGMTREGYRLVGWSVDPLAKEPQYETGSGFIMGNDNTVMYAVWEKWGVQKKADHDDHAHYYEQTWGVNCDECIMKSGCDHVGRPDDMCDAKPELADYSDEGTSVGNSEISDAKDSVAFDGTVDFDALNAQFLSSTIQPSAIPDLTDEELAALNPDFNDDDEDDD